MAVPGKRAGEQSTSSISSNESADDLKVYCQPCDRDGQRLAAHGYCTNCCEHLCESCFKHHKRHTLSRDHKLLDKTNMPQTLQHATTVHYRQQDGLTKPCPKHKKEEIKFFCEDHKTLLCSVCVTLEHQPTYCNVNYIPDISKHVIDGDEYFGILKNIDAISARYHKMKEHVDKAFSKSNSSLKNALKDIKKFRKEINKRLDELEMQAESRANDIIHDNAKNLNKVESAYKEATNSLQTSSEKIKHLNTSKQEYELFMEFKHAEQMISEYDKKLADLASFDIKEYNFTRNETILMLLAKEKTLGTLVQTSLKTICSAAASKIETRQFSHHGEICVKTSNDKNCRVTGMTLLTPDLLIITDWWNRSIQMVNISSQSVSDQLQLYNCPFDITTVSSTELAVTLPANQTIQFVSILSNKLIKKQTIKVNGQCHGISCYQGKLVVSYIDPAKLQILDINGKILNTFENRQISFPEYIATNSQFIYVSDRKMKGVTSLNWQGNVIAIYRSMTLPKGIALSDNGSVFVCDEKREVVEELSRDFSTGKVVLDIINPNAVCWCNKTRKIYFSCFTGSEIFNNYLQIFKMT